MAGGGSKCKICLKVFNYAPNARKHVKIHGFDQEPAAERTCPNCGKIFRYATLCKLHVKRTCSSPPELQILECNKCHETFDTRQQLKGHIRTQHAVDTRQLRCRQCRKLFDCQAAVEEHRCPGKEPKALCSEPLFQCSECVKRYTTKGALKLHTETAHRGVRFPCPHCPFSLSNRQALDRHIRNVHEVVVCRFKCPTCGKAFKVQ